MVFTKTIFTIIHKQLYNNYIQVKYTYLLSKKAPNVKFMFSKKATKIDEIFTVDLTVTT